MSALVLQLHGVMAGSVTRQSASHPHRILRFGKISALVSRCPHDGALEHLDASEMAKQAMTHHELLLAYCTDYALLPMRFGAYFSSIDAIRRSLAREEKAHLAALTHLAGTQEFAIKLNISAVAPIANEPASGSGAQFLVRRRKARDARQSAGQDRASFAESLAQSLAAIAPAVSYNKGNALLHLGLLLSPADRSMLQQLVHERGPQAAQLGLSLEATGPWPAYSFDADQLHKVACNGA